MPPQHFLLPESENNSIEREKERKHFAAGDEKIRRITQTAYKGKREREREREGGGGRARDFLTYVHQNFSNNAKDIKAATEAGRGAECKVLAVRRFEYSYGGIFVILLTYGHVHFFLKTIPRLYLSGKFSFVVTAKLDTRIEWFLFTKCMLLLLMSLPEST
jgi:hypothetical protein